MYLLVQPELARFIEANLNENELRYKEKIFWFIHSINIRTTLVESSPDAFTPLNSNILKSVLGNYPVKELSHRPFSFILRFLKKHNIVEVEKNKKGNDKYLAGKESKNYRLTDRWRFLHPRQFMLLDERFTVHLKKQKEADFDPTLNYLSANAMNLKSLRIDLSGAVKSLEICYDTKLVDYIRNKRVNEIIINNDKDEREDYYTFQRQFILSLQFNYYLQQCRRSHVNYRFNTTLTSLKKDLRKFIYLPGTSERLMILDCKNSQPLLFYPLVLEYFEGEIKKDVENYGYLTQEGGFYEFIAEKANEDISNYKDRDRLKKELFKQVFYNKLVPGWNDGKYLKIFKKEFPSVWEVIHHYKNTKVLSKGPRELAIGMQRKEAEIWLDTITKALYEKYPDIFFTTIHDSIVCLESDVEKVMKEIKLGYNKFGLLPCISLEVFSENKQPTEETNIIVSNGYEINLDTYLIKEQQNEEDPFGLDIFEVYTENDSISQQVKEEQIDIADIEQDIEVEEPDPDFEEDFYRINGGDCAEIWNKLSEKGITEEQNDLLSYVRGYGEVGLELTISPLEYHSLKRFLQLHNVEIDI